MRLKLSHLIQVQLKIINLCHSGKWYAIIKKYVIGNQRKYDKQNDWDTSTLIELRRTTPYLHNGKYEKIEDIFRIEKHGIKESISESDLQNLTAYLLSL